MDDEGLRPYCKASYLEKLKERGDIVLTDLDGTFASGDHAPTERELGDRASVRRLLDKKGVVAGAVTARTPALTMSDATYQASRSNGFREPEPRWGVDPATGRRVYVPLDRVPFFEYCLDWDVVAGFGSGIYPRNGHGYLVDHEYEQQLGHDRTRIRKKGTTEELIRENSEPWRLSLMCFLVAVFPDVRDHLSPLEYKRNYDRGITDVAPLNYRFQLEFRGSAGLDRMRLLKQIIHEEAAAGDPVAIRITTVDESRPHPTDPEQSKYTLYLVPYAARKEKMINRLVGQSARSAGRETKNLRLFYAGDTLTDLNAGLWGGGDADTTFLLATGSRVAPYILGRKPTFGSESLDFLWSSANRPGDRFLPTNERGIYTFNLPGGYKKPNRIIIGDERYPGCTPPGSVAAFLHEFL